MSDGLMQSMNKAQPIRYSSKCHIRRDPAVFGAMPRLERQKDQIELIASENIVSRAVLEAQGSVLTNNMQKAIRVAGITAAVNLSTKQRPWPSSAPALFGCNFANVQPHSGAQANQAVMLALLEPGDTIMGLSLMLTAILRTVHRQISLANGSRL